MKKINLVYDGEYDDVDILGIPDEIYSEIDDLAQEYLSWIPPKDDSLGWTDLNGKRVLAKETAGFLRWLNENRRAKEKAVVLEEHTGYDKSLKRIDF